MSWTIYCIKNSTVVPAACAQKCKEVIGKKMMIFNDYYGDGWMLDAADKEDGPLFFNIDHMEHMDWISGEAVPEFFEIMKEFKVNGEVHFMDAEQGDPVDFWGHRWVDGEYTALTGKLNVDWVPSK